MPPRRGTRAAARRRNAARAARQGRTRLLRRRLLRRPDALRLADQRQGGGMSGSPPFDLDAARARFTALQRELVFFDGPGGTQVPDSVIDAIAGYLRESNANVSGPYETSRRTEALVEDSRAAGASFLGCGAEEVIFGANMMTLNFALTRTVGSEVG